MKIITNSQYLLLYVFLLSFVNRVSAQQATLTLSTYSNQAEITATQWISLQPGFKIPDGKNVRVYISEIKGQCLPLVSSPSLYMNYIISNTVKVAGIKKTSDLLNRKTCEISQSIQYFDGLGRPIQTLQTMGSPGSKDLIQQSEYDQFGKQSLKYLPYTSAINPGGFKSDTLTKGYRVRSFYSQIGQNYETTPVPFSETVFEASALNRPLEQGAPGTNWQIIKDSQGNSLQTGKTVKIAYGLNGTNDVKLWTVNATGATAAYYEKNQLYKTITKNENWKAADGVWGTIEEFKDKEDRIVLSRTYNTNPQGATEILSTYYVYDNLKNLRYVIPPAVSVNSFTEKDAVFDELIYAYRYDDRHRLIEKKIPGAGWVHMVYNEMDQMVFSQDSMQRSRNEWMFTKYDAQGRTILSGIHINSAKRSALQQTVAAQAVLWESRKGGTHYGYTKSSLPQTNMKVLTANYYDDYNFSQATTYPYQADSLNTQSLMTRGLLTGSMVKILNSTDSLWTVNYYDDESRIIQSHQQNYIGGKDVYNSKYSFTGQPLVTKRVHTNSKGTGTQTYLYWYQYDHAGRKLRTLHKAINGTVNASAQPVVLADYTYNELGELIVKKVHLAASGTTAQTINYQYNIRGWLKKINNPSTISATSTPKFGLELKYDDGTTPQYNGNISGMIWRGTKNQAPMMEYAFSYDQLNRLLKAQSLQGGNYQERIDGYDLMGNILKLSRRSNNDLIDSLKYTYRNSGVSNRLDRLDELSDASIQLKDLGFKEPIGMQQDGEYDYDGNGNMLIDKNAGITTKIVYNYLNLPQTIIAGSNIITYTYDATGRKLRKTVGTTSEEYVDGLQLQTFANATTIRFITTEEGRANWVGAISPYNYYYNLTDHLGNARVTVNESGAVMQEDSYYAFGLQMPGKSFNAENKYLYNGKELQVETGWYDYGARQYNPMIARWHAIDPMAEKFYTASGYIYGGSNPIFYNDNDGQVIEPWWIRYNIPKSYKFPVGAVWYTKTNKEMPLVSHYDYFVTEDSYREFNVDFNKLARTSKAFGVIFRDLYYSEHTYRVAEFYYNTINPDIEAAYESEHRIIKVFYGSRAGDALFEEFFHAGQDNYYSGKGIKKLNLEDEIEAKMANLYFGFKDNSVKKSYNNIISYLTKKARGKEISGGLQEEYLKEMNELMNQVYADYTKDPNSAVSREKSKISDVNQKIINEYLINVIKRQ